MITTRYEAFPRDVRTGALEAEMTSLGRDCAAASLRLDERAPPAFQRAYRSFRGVRSRATYFEKKWLGLRLNAIKRGFVLDCGVRPDVLEALTASRCPVSLEEYSFASQNPSNPSVDRLHNEGTYAQGNLVVVTQRVNRAKGAKTFEEIVDIATTCEDADGLTAIEWARLASLTYGAWDAYNGGQDPYLLPLSTYPGPKTFTAQSQVVQLLLLRVCVQGNWERASLFWLDLTHRAGLGERDLLDFLERLKAHCENGDFAPTAWTDQAIFSGFANWYLAAKSEIDQALGALRMNLQKQDTIDATLGRWAVGARASQ